MEQMKNKNNNQDGRKKSSKYSEKQKSVLKKENKKTAGIPKRQRKMSGAKLPTFSDEIRLNKYLSNAGVCSRREADTLIKSGVVSVNGKIITEMGHKVKSTDAVTYDRMPVNLETKRYFLLNKPSGFSLRYDITTKKSVYHLIKKACKETIYPIGKLHSETTGLVIFTNDSDMVKKLTHPKFKVSQLFHVFLNKPISEEDLAQLTKGLFVDNKMFSAEDAQYVKGRPNHEIGVKFQSSNSNIVKLMLGKMGYTITKLDRVEYAGLTKLDLPRGKYRELQAKEIGFLKMS